MKYEEWIEYERARLAALQQSLVDRPESAEPIQGDIDIMEDGTDREERQVSVDVKEEGSAVLSI